MNEANATHREIERIYNTWDKMLAKRDVEGALALYAPDATLESPLIPHLLQTERGICRGTEQLGHFLTIVFQRTPARRRHFRSGYFTDGKRLIWEYPRQTPDGEQMNFAEVMDIEQGLIKHHRVYWGWFGVQIMKSDKYRRESE